MTVTAYFRGHLTYHDEETLRWRYMDTDEPADFEGVVRPCARCGRVFEGSNIGEPDPCLGNLPGVDNACCGHGIPEEAYIRFTSGVVIKGFDVITYTEKWAREATAATDQLRGHPMYWDGEQYRYRDTDEPTATTWCDRPCGHCGQPRTAEGHDPCWGEIPGAMNACCGHGDNATAYVQIIDGTVIQGDDAVRLVEILNRLQPRTENGRSSTDAA